ncbi:hypothetical protein [Fibrobacter sp.]|uniref:hypothetical protein n=1 Tax=Fibrobacter sp. TaxID=35828 RepID=UPI003890C19D
MEIRLFNLLKGTLAVFILGACACSQSVGPASSLQDDQDGEVSTNYSSADGDTPSQTQRSSSSSLSEPPASSSSAEIKFDTQDSAKVAEIKESPFDSVTIDRPVVFKAPSVSAVIFHWDTTSSAYQFRVVVDGNYSTYAIMESETLDSLVYEFKWNDDDPKEWKRVGISVSQGNTNSVNYVNYAEKDIDGKKNLCVSYASARIVWIDKDGQSIFTEWSEPVGPLYTLTISTEARTTFAPYSGNPCKS